MGCGKTYWGKKWAELAGLNFFDLDEMVEAEQSKTAGQIFAEDGEDFFREQETKSLYSLPENENFIVATGGGTPCFNDNISWMNLEGISIYLKSSPIKILERLVNETNKRPLIKDLNKTELEFYITEKIKEREFFYHQAKIILEVDDLDPKYLPSFLIL
jgi:shikimate kinase